MGIRSEAVAEFRSGAVSGSFFGGGGGGCGGGGGDERFRTLWRFIFRT